MPKLTGKLKTLARRVGEHLNPGTHREAVGGLWEELGRLQFDFLVQQGLKPQHYFLDVGCGSLRGGIHFVRYLDTGHYFGIDIDDKLLQAGRQELKTSNLLHKKPTLMQTDRFDFQALHQTFDYALAQSVFTHLPLNSIVRCLASIAKVLKTGGRFCATFFENPGGKLNLEPLAHPRTDGPDIVSFFDKDPYHYDFPTMEWSCKGTGLRAEYLGDWSHPRNQKMMVFVKRELS